MDLNILKFRVAGIVQQSGRQLRPNQTRIEAIFAAVYMTGMQEGREYLPQVVP